jgi:DNA adenine methylase
LTFDTEQEGDAYVKRLEQMRDAGILPEHLVARRSDLVTVGDAIRSYMTKVSLPSSDASLLNALLERLGDQPLTGLDYQWAENWVKSMKRRDVMAPSTICHYVGALARYFDWVVRSGTPLLATNPLRLLPKRYAIQRAARSYYLQKSCFGGKLEGQTFGTATTTPPGLNLLRLEEELSAAHLRLANTFVERLGWAACIERYDRPHTLFYLDPPYFETEGYGVPFPYTEYEKMADRLRSIKGRAIVSLNDHPAIREAFTGFHIETVDIRYTVGGSGDRAAARKELIIFSWDDTAQPAGLF